MPVQEKQQSRSRRIAELKTLENSQLEDLVSTLTRSDDILNRRLTKNMLVHIVITREYPYAEEVYDSLRKFARTESC